MSFGVGVAMSGVLSGGTAMALTPIESVVPAVEAVSLTLLTASILSLGAGTMIMGGGFAASLFCPEESRRRMAEKPKALAIGFMTAFALSPAIVALVDGHTVEPDCAAGFNNAVCAVTLDNDTRPAVVITPAPIAPALSVPLTPRP